MPLLDAYGRPVKQAELTQPKAEAGITGVRQPFVASVAYGLTPQRLSSILRACDQGDITEYAKFAEEMEERDPHYSSVLGVRKRAVSGVEPTVTPASESARDVEIAEAVQERIAEDDLFPDLVEDLLDGLGKGFSVVEINWAKTARQWWPQSYDWVTQRHFKFDKETGRDLRLIDEADPANGIPLEPFKFAIHRPKLKSGLTCRGGLARIAAFGWMCKSYSLKDWMAFVETYGLPLRLGRYGPEATREDVEKLYLAVANIGTDAAAVLPKSMEIEFEQIASSGGDKPVFENLCRFIDEQTSKAVLGQTMTSDDGSSMAQAEVHDGVRHDIAAADARQVNATIARDVVKPFVDLNYGVQPKYPKLKIVIEEPEDVELAMNALPGLVAVGLKVKQSEVRSKLRFSDPEEGDELLGAPAPAQGTPPSAAPTPDPDPEDAEDEAEAANRGIFEPAPGLDADPAGFDPFGTADEIEAQMMAEWQEVTEEALTPIEAALAAATDYEDFRRRLAAIPEMPAGLLIDGLVKGLFKSRSTGDQRDG
ncbi:MAG: DUF935 domain-containing protein [Pseudomonadota bacterium]